MNLRPGADLGGGAIGAIAPPITDGNNFFHHEFLQFGKQHW